MSGCCSCRFVRGRGNASIVARRLGSRQGRRSDRARARRGWTRGLGRFGIAGGRWRGSRRGSRPRTVARLPAAGVAGRPAVAGPGPGRSVRRRGSARRRGGRGSTPRPTRGRGARRRAALVVELGEDDEALRPDGGYRRTRDPDRRFGQRPDLPHPPCRKRSFATQADRLRPCLEDRRLGSRWTRSGTPWERPASTRYQRLPRPRVRRPGTTGRGSTAACGPCGRAMYWAASLVAALSDGRLTASRCNARLRHGLLAERRLRARINAAPRGNPSRSCSHGALDSTSTLVANAHCGASSGNRCGSFRNSMIAMRCSCVYDCVG